MIKKVAVMIACGFLLHFTMNAELASFHHLQEKEKSTQVARQMSENSPNCIDIAFLENGGCVSEPVSLEISDKVLSVTNCFLKQLPHLNRELIQCTSSDSDCIKSLLGYQKSAIKSVWERIDLYCTIHKQRSTTNTFAESFIIFSKSSDILAEQVKQTAKVNEEVLQASEESLKQIETMRKLEMNSLDFGKIDQESQKLKDEIREIESTLPPPPAPRSLLNLGSLQNLVSVSSLIDIYSFIFLFMMKIVWIFFHSVLSSSSLEVSAYEMISDLVVGIFVNWVVDTVGGVEIFYSLRIPEVYIASLKILAFAYFGVSKLFISILKKSTKSREDSLVSNIASNIKRMISAIKRTNLEARDEDNIEQQGSGYKNFSQQGMHSHNLAYDTPYNRSYHNVLARDSKNKHHKYTNEIEYKGTDYPLNPLCVAEDISGSRGERRQEQNYDYDKSNTRSKSSKKLRTIG